MRAFYIPVTLLALILVFSLLTNRYVQQNTAQWIESLDAVTALADAEQWESVKERISEVQQDWLRHDVVHHVILKHQDLDAAEELFAGALAACHAKDGAELHIHLQQLITQLQFLAETQDARLENFF